MSPAPRWWHPLPGRRLPLPSEGGMGPGGPRKSPGRRGNRLDKRRGNSGGKSACARRPVFTSRDRRVASGASERTREASRAASCVRLTTTSSGPSSQIGSNGAGWTAARRTGNATAAASHTAASVGQINRHLQSQPTKMMKMKLKRDQLGL